MTKQLLTVFLSALLFGVAAQAAAPVQDSSIKTQATLTEESSVNEVRWYQVELLIFKQRPISTEIDEIWPKDIVLSYPDNWETLKSPDDYQAIYQKKSAVNTPFILLDKKNYQFAGIKSKLQTNRNDILFHAAWRQSLTQNIDKKNNNAPTSILIRGGQVFDGHAELEGSISLNLLRYLHIHTNLWLTHFVPATTKPTTETAAANNPVTENTVAENKDAAQVPAEVNWPELPMYPALKNQMLDDSSAPNTEVPEKKYQIDEIVFNEQSRRMRSYETHYIDHPKFGILVRLIPLDKNTLQPIPPAQ